MDWIELTDSMFHWQGSFVLDLNLEALSTRLTYVVHFWRERRFQAIFSAYARVFGFSCQRFWYIWHLRWSFFFLLTVHVLQSFILNATV